MSCLFLASPILGISGWESATCKVRCSPERDYACEEAQLKMRFLNCDSCLRERLFTFGEIVNCPRRASLQRLSDMRLMLQAVSTQL